MKLNNRQKAFADYYIQLDNATEAALQAGYSPKTARAMGSENLTKPHIRSYIDERLAQIEDARIATAAEVLQHLTRVLRGEETEEVVVVEGVGEGASAARTVEKQVGAKERLKAAELLGKRFGLYVDKVNVDAGDLVVKVDYGDRGAGE